MNVHRFRRILFAAAACGLAIPAAPADPSPRPLTVRIVGDKILKPILTRFAALYTSRYPGTRLTSLPRDPPVGFDGIVAGVSPFAHEAWGGEVDAFSRLYGYRPLDIRIGRIGFAADRRTMPPFLVVNEANPPRGLTFAQFSRVFTSGQIPSDLRRWALLGVDGSWAQHAIHIYGTRDDGLDLTTLRTTRLHGLPSRGITKLWRGTWMSSRRCKICDIGPGFVPCRPTRSRPSSESWNDIQTGRQ